MARASCTCLDKLRLPLSHPKSTHTPQNRNAIDDLLYREARRIDHFSIGRGLQWGNRTGRIPQVPLGDLARKGGKANIRPLVFQLLIAAQSPLVGACGEKYLEVGPWKYNRAHIPPVGHQAGGPRKGTLTVQKRAADVWPGCNARGALPSHLGPDCVCCDLSIEEHPLTPIGCDVKSYVKAGCKSGVTFYIIGLQSPFEPRQGHET